MQPTQPGAPGPASVPQYGTNPQDVDRAFDDMRVEPSRGERLKAYAEPRVRAAREYLETHKLATAGLGFVVGFVLGRLVRRS